MKVQIPFMLEFRDRMIAGGKTCTSRTSAKGGPGDTFEAFGREFEITAVERMTLADVSCHLHRAEGFQTPDRFIRIWNRIHPEAGYRPEQRVVVHHFRILPKAGGAECAKP